MDRRDLDSVAGDRGWCHCSASRTRTLCTPSKLPRRRDSPPLRFRPREPPDFSLVGPTRRASSSDPLVGPLPSRPSARKKLRNKAHSFQRPAGSARLAPSAFPVVDLLAGSGSESSIGSRIDPRAGGVLLLRRRGVRWSRRFTVREPLTHPARRGGAKASSSPRCCARSTPAS